MGVETRRTGVSVGQHRIIISVSRIRRQTETHVIHIDIRLELMIENLLERGKQIIEFGLVSLAKELWPVG